MSREKVKTFKAFREYKDFFVMPQLLCLFMGIDVTQKYPRRKLLLTLLAVAGCFLHVYMLYRVIKKLQYNIRVGDAVDFWLVACFLMYQFDMVCKLWGLLWHRDRLREVYEELSHSYPTTSEELEMYGINENHATASRPLLITCNYVSCLFIVVEPLLESILKYVHHKLTLRADEVRFVYLKPMPVEHSYDFRSPGFYALFYIIEAVQCFLAISAVFGNDMWLISFTNQICLHFRYISKSLISYKPAEANEAKDCEFLRRLVRRHQAILKTLNDLNAIFGTTLLGNLISTTTVLCFVCFQLTVVDFGMLYMNYCLFVVTTTCKFFFLCNSGDQLILTSTDIAAAAYESAWYEGSHRYKKQILIVMMRAQKPAKLSAKGFQTISLLTFQLVLSMSYKVFTLLQSTIE